MKSKNTREELDEVDKTNELRRHGKTWKSANVFLFW
jgi:hypothetical protein